MTTSQEASRYYVRPDVYGIELLEATFINHHFARHAHDYYAIGVIERGVQSFSAGSNKYITPPGGAFLLNPGVPHTGEPFSAVGFTYCSFYPTQDLLEKVATEITGHPRSAPYFAPTMVNDSELSRRLIELKNALTSPVSSLESQTQLLHSFAYLIAGYADSRYPVLSPGEERRAVRIVREFLEAHYSQDISLQQLADMVSLSSYYLARVFQAEVGWPIHAYLESVRICQAQRLLTLGHPIAFVAHEVGFVDQSHFTNRFKRFLGLTPRQYAQQRKILQDFILP